MTIVALKWSAAARAMAAAVAATLLMSCGQDSPERLMASVKEYLAKGDRNAAVIQLKNLLSRAPDNGEARLLLGEALLEDEDYVSAEKELSRALELKQPQEKAFPLYVRALLAQGKNKSVIAEVEKYKLFNPQAVAATQTALGDAHMRLGSRARAREAYAAAGAAVQGYPRARLGEAMLAAFEGRIEEASKQIDEVVAADPKLAEARVLRADILLAKGDRTGAKKELEEAISTNERFLPARFALIGLLGQEGALDAVDALIESTRKIAPADLRVAYLDAEFAFRRDQLSRARQQLQQVLKYLPSHVPSLVLLGAIDLKERQFSAAETGLRVVLARVPSHVGARQLLVQTYLRSGQPAKARETLQPLIDSDAISGPHLQMLAGETFLANGDVQRATAFYQAATKGTDRQQGAAHARLGQIALATGRNLEGFKELELASELDSGAHQADLALIAGHLRRKEFDKAMEAARTLEKKQPKNPLTFQMYGLINLAKGDRAAARKSLERALELQPVYLPAAHTLAQLDIMAKQPEDARKRYEAMIAREPQDEQIHIALAELLARTGAAPNDVGVALQRAVTANPQAPPPRLALISFYLRAGDTKAALAAAQDALAALPSDPGVLDAAGVAQEQAGEINQAIVTYNKLAALQPHVVQPLNRLAALYLKQNDTEKAIDSLRRAQKIAPRGHDVQSQLVQVYVSAGRPDDALKEARELQKREPKFAGGYSIEGDIHFSQRRFSEAERLYREALKREPRANAVAVKLHGALWASGKRAEANSLAKNWVSDNPKDAVMRLYLAERELAAKNLKASAMHYQAAVEIEPTNALALNNLAWISSEVGDGRALAYAERAVKLAPNNPSVLDTYGMLLLKQGRTSEALLVLQRGRRLAPARHDLRLNYAKALIKAGKKDEARKELEALQSVRESFRGKDEVVALSKGL